MISLFLNVRVSCSFFQFKMVKFCKGALCIIALLAGVIWLCVELEINIIVVFILFEWKVALRTHHL